MIAPPSRRRSGFCKGRLKRRGKREPGEIVVPPVKPFAGVGDCVGQPTLTPGSRSLSSRPPPGPAQVQTRTDAHVACAETPHRAEDAQNLPLPSERVKIGDREACWHLW